MAEQPIEVFFSYSREDKPLRDKLEKHLISLKRQGVISLWHDRQIVAGSKWEEEIDHHMRTADIILLLVSPDFVASKYCYEIELPDAMARHDAGEAYVVPILLRPVAGWKNLPFAKLQVYPSGGLAVTRWGNEDDAFVDVAEEIEVAVEKLLEQRREGERLNLEKMQRERDEQESKWVGKGGVGQWLCETIGTPGIHIKLQFRAQDIRVICEGIPCPDRTDIGLRLISALQKVNFNTLVPVAHQPIYRIIIYGRPLWEVGARVESLHPS